MPNPFARIIPLNLFRKRKPAASVNLPQTIPNPVPEPEGYAAQVARAPEPEELGKIVAEMDGDYQVAFARRVLAANIASINVTISVDGANADPRAEAIAEKLQTLWKDTVAAMQDAIGYGRKAFEKTWDYDPATNVTYIRKLDGLEFEDSKLKLGDKGRFEGIAVKLADDEWETIEPANAWWLALDPTGKYPHGRSRYFPAVHKAWKEKRDAAKNLSLYVRRFAIRGGWAHIPFREEDPERPGQFIDVAAKTAEAIEAYYSGGTGLLPNDLHPGDPTKYKYDFTEADPQGLDPTPLLNVIQQQWDVAILRAFGIPEKTVTEGGETGSFAMVSQQMLTLFAVVESILSQFVASFNKYVCEPTRETNYGEGMGPKFKASFPTLTNKPGGIVLELVKLLMSNPQFITAIMSGAVDLRQILTDAGLPLVDNFEAIMQDIAARMAATQGAAVPAAPMANQPAAGEFGSLSRRQWQNNSKAIKDVLDGLKSGDMSETYALTMLQSLGLTAERAQAVIDDARDGVVDDPELKAVGMANTAKPRGLGISVPKQDALLREALETYDALFEDLIDALAKGETKRVDAIRDEILTLEAEMRMASRVLGMLSLWSPSINTYGDGDAKQITQAIAMANADGFASRFPWLRRAFDWLAGKQIVKASDFAKMIAADRKEVLSVPGVESVRTLKKIRTKLAKALDTGEDFRTFRKAIEEDVALSRAQTETLFRTNIKGGYVAGFETAMSHPAVEEEFPYVMFKATPDSRVRDEHWDMDGFVCSKKDPAYKTLLRLVKDYNCRCALIPLSAEQATRYTIKTYDDIPAEVLSTLAV